MLLRRELGDIDIEDLPLPFFCVSSNLTTGRIAVHQQGPLWRWLRASVAIPGVLPPVFQGGEVFVDGGAMNNLPVDVMRAKGRGPGDRRGRRHGPRVHDRRRGDREAVRSGTCSAAAADTAPEHPADPLARRHGEQRHRDARAAPAERPADHAGARVARPARLERDSSARIEIGYRDACERLAGGALAQLQKVYAANTLS